MPKRAYPIVRLDQDTEVTTLILHSVTAELIEFFAADKMISKNDLCRGLPTKGLIAYLTAERSLLRAFQSLHNEESSATSRA
jgi:hypothetical protein